MYDALTVAAVVDQINNELIDGRIQQVAHVDAATLAFEVYSSHRLRWLVTSADHVYARVQISDERIGTDPERVSPLLLLLRKHVRGGRIVAVSQPRYERIIRLSIAKHIRPNNADDDSEGEDEQGELVYSELVSEIMGRRSNVILLEDSGRIRDSIRRVTPDMSRVRVVLPGRDYALPPAQDKLEPQGASQIDLLRDAVTTDEPLARWLVSRYLGLSPLIAREVVTRAGLEATLPPRDLQAAGAAAIARALDDVFAPLETGDWQPMLYSVPGRDPVASPIRLRSLEEIEGSVVRPCMTISEAVAQAVAGAGTAVSELATRHAPRRERLVAEIEEARARAGQRIRSLEEQQELSARAESWRAMGEAIYAGLADIRHNATELVTEDGLTIALDPTLSPSENAQRYFERYRKAQSAATNIPELLGAAKLQTSYLDQLLFTARQSETFDEIESTRQEWLAWQRETSGDTRVDRKKAPRPSASARRPRAFRSSRGDMIWIGRTGQQNEAVTFEIANPGDLWLHARNMPGAHVILRWNGPDDDAVLEIAASLAAWYSDGRSSTSVPIDVAERRHVRKLRGGGPGMVTYRNERTLNVRPRPADELGLSTG